MICVPRSEVLMAFHCSFFFLLLALRSHILKGRKFLMCLTAEGKRGDGRVIWFPAANADFLLPAKHPAPCSYR